MDDKKPSDLTDARSVDHEVGIIAEPAEGQYWRSISHRQIHVISLGGQIGAGLFISTGKNLRDGGPGGMLLGFLMVCSCVWCLHQTVSEMTISFPISGNFISYANRFVDPALAFAAGVSMWLGWTAVVAAEATFFSVIVNYWAQDSVPDAVWYTVFLVVMIGIFLLPSRWFAWFEYLTAILKVLALVIFIITGFAIVVGAGPRGYVHHGETWENGLAFKNGFKGFSNSVLLAILAIGDNTFTGFLAGEAESPRYSVAHAAFVIPVRVTTIYSICCIFIGLLVSPNNESLFGGSGIAASPFVIAIDLAGIPGLPHLLNVVILFAVSSIGAESIFVASRIIRSLSHERVIPSWISRIDSRGRPRGAIAITIVGAIALTYCNLSAGGITVFNWLAQIASTGYFMVWVVVAITSFRFRAALRAQDDPLFRQVHAWSCDWWPFPPIWLLLCCAFYTGCSVYLGLYPIGTNSPSAYSFFQYTIGIILILASGIGYKLICRSKLQDPKTADLQTGRRPLSDGEIVALDEYNRLSPWRKFGSMVQLW
ncbi:amino acid permease [Xylariaceae sp. FL0016]|nr:amino acid permease [Xylariaceae sp. FL0016]